MLCLCTVKYLYKNNPKNTVFQKLHTNVFLSHLKKQWKEKKKINFQCSDEAT